MLGLKTKSELTGVLAPAQLADIAATASTFTAEQRAAVRTAYTDAFREDMIIACAVTGLGLLVSLLIYRKNRPTILEQQRARYVEETKRRRASRAPVLGPDAPTSV